MPNGNGLRWFLDLDGHRQLPPALYLLWVIGIGVLFVPEKTWIMAGVDVKSVWAELSPLLQYQLMEMEHRNSAYMFWLLSPFLSLLASALFVVKYNGPQYCAYMRRREVRMRSHGKGASAIDVRLIFGLMAVILGYFWALLYGRFEPSLLGDFVPTKNRFALAVIHGWALLLIMPICLAVLIAEIRASLSVILNLREQDGRD